MTTTDMFPVETRDLVKSYGDSTAIRGVNLKLAQGTVTGLLGKNGAGKTTLIKCILGLLRPSSGGATVLGADAVNLPPEIKARIGYVPQEPAIYPWMRVSQAIAYQGSFYPVWDQDLVDQLLQTFELGPRERVGTLSVGQLQKLAILLALASRPDILLLDEPVAALDPDGRRAFLRMLLDLVSDGGRTILLSTHITSDVERVCSHVAVLRNGELLHYCELDFLRETVKELRITGNNLPVDELKVLPGVLAAKGNASAMSLTVQGNIGELIGLIRALVPCEVNVLDLNLEDMFIALHER